MEKLYYRKIEEDFVIVSHIPGIPGYFKPQTEFTFGNPPNRTFTVEYFNKYIEREHWMFVGDLNG
jgi:hypothetical protein